MTVNLRTCPSSLRSLGTVRCWAAVVSVGVLAACGSSTTTSGTAEGTTPGVDPATTTDSPSSVVPETTVATNVPATTATTAPPDFTPVTEPPATDASPETTAPDPTPPDTAAPDTAPDTAAPATTAAPTPPTAGTAVVYGGSGGAVPWFPMLWWDGATWNQAGYTADGGFVVPPAPSIESVSATSLDLPDGPGQVIGGLSLGPDDFYCVGDEMGPVIAGVDLADTPVSLGYDALAVTADWPLQPRPVLQVGADNPEYATIGASFVDAPTAGDGTVSQAVRADLDGDGIEEVLVTYEYLTDDQFGAENDFSVVYVRIPGPDGSVTDQVLEEYVLEAPEDFPTIGRFTVAAVADLNGDGIMEVATRSSFWESASMSAWGLDGDALVRIGSGGCGV